MFNERPKPIRIIGDPNNQRPDKWSYTVIKLISGLLSLLSLMAESAV